MHTCIFSKVEKMAFFFINSHFIAKIGQSLVNSWKNLIMADIGVLLYLPVSCPMHKIRFYMTLNLNITIKLSPFLFEHRTLKPCVELVWGNPVLFAPYCAVQYHGPQMYHYTGVWLYYSLKAFKFAGRLFFQETITIL